MDLSSGAEDSRTSMVGRKRDLGELDSNADNLAVASDKASEERLYKRAKQYHDPSKDSIDEEIVGSPSLPAANTPLEEPNADSITQISWNKDVQSGLRTSFGSKPKSKSLPKTTHPALQAAHGARILEGSASDTEGSHPIASAIVQEDEPQAGEFDGTETFGMSAQGGQATTAELASPSSVTLHKDSAGPGETTSNGLYIAVQCAFKTLEKWSGEQREPHVDAQLETAQLQQPYLTTPSEAVSNTGFPAEIFLGVEKSKSSQRNLEYVHSHYGTFQIPEMLQDRKEVSIEQITWRDFVCHFAEVNSEKAALLGPIQVNRAFELYIERYFRVASHREHTEALRKGPDWQKTWQQAVEDLTPSSRAAKLGAQNPVSLPLSVLQSKGSTDPGQKALNTFIASPAGDEDGDLDDRDSNSQDLAMSRDNLKPEPSQPASNTSAGPVHHTSDHSSAQRIPAPGDYYDSLPGLPPLPEVSAKLMNTERVIEYATGNGIFRITEMFHHGIPVSVEQFNFYDFAYHLAGVNFEKAQLLKPKQVKVAFEKYLQCFFHGAAPAAKETAKATGNKPGWQKLWSSARQAMKHASVAGEAGSQNSASLEMSIPQGKSRADCPQKTVATSHMVSPASHEKDESGDGEPDGHDLEMSENINTDALELVLQQRYFMPVNGVAPKARCLSCGDNAHKTVDCPEMSCGSCGLNHRSTRCPKNQICAKCRKKGHSIVACREKLSISKGELICDLCSSKSHTEANCHLIWRSYAPKPEEIVRVKDIPTHCYSCGAPRHYGPECGMYRTNLLSGIPTWSKPNRDKYIETGPSLPARSIAIMGMANNPITLEDSDDDVTFIQPKVSNPPSSHSRDGNNNISIKVEMRATPPQLQSSNEFYRAPNPSRSARPIFPHERGGRVSPTPKQDPYQPEVPMIGYYQPPPQHNSGNMMAGYYQQAPPPPQRNMNQRVPMNDYYQQAPPPRVRQNNHKQPAAGYYSGPPSPLPAAPPVSGPRENRARGGRGRGGGAAGRGNSGAGRGGRGGGSGGTLPAAPVKKSKRQRKRGREAAAAAAGDA